MAEAIHEIVGDEHASAQMELNFDTQVTEDRTQSE